MSKRILILASAEDAESTQINDNFVARVQAGIDDDVQIEWHNYRDICIWFKTGTIEVSLLSTGELLSMFDFVYIKSFFRYSEYAAAIAAYLDQQHIPYVCTELRNHIALTKITQFVRLSHAGIPIAKTLLLHPAHYVAQYDRVVERLGLPFIFKSTDGSGGDENYLINSQAELEAAIAAHPSLHFVAQSFIANDSDLRVLIVGNNIELIIKRTRAGESHLNNTSQGGAAELVNVDSLPEAHRQLALKAANVMEREVAGVDLMFESGTGDPYVLEVNASPQIGSGAFMDEKVAIYCKYFINMVQ